MKPFFLGRENLSTYRRDRGRRGHVAGRRCALEPLEVRALLSVVVVVNGKSATFTDVDGDLVTVAVSVGTLTGANFVTAAAGSGERLQIIDLSAGGFDGANVTVSAKVAGGGDGKVNVGYINSTGQNLGNVTVNGDLGQIDIGNGIGAAVGKLWAKSMGVQGLATQGGTGSLKSNIVGAVGSLVVAGEVKDAYLFVTGGVNGKIGLIDIGSLTGGADMRSGVIEALGDVGQVKVKNSVVGGAGDASAAIVSVGGKMGNVSIGGSLVGGSGHGAGQIFCGTSIGAINIAGDIQGGSGSNAGLIVAHNGSLASLSVGGSIIGGGSDRSAFVYSKIDMGAVKITGNLIGGSSSFAGEINADGKIASVTIGGNVQGGTGYRSGIVLAHFDLGPVKITGNLEGGSGGGAGAIVSESGKIAGVTLGGSLIGGSAIQSGVFFSHLSTGLVRITGNIVGGAGESSGTLQILGKAVGLTVGGSLIGGEGKYSGSIMSHGDLGPVTVTQDVTGGEAELSGSIFSDEANVIAVTVGGFITGGGGVNSGVISAHTNMGKATVGKDVRGGNGTNSGCIQAMTGKLAGVTVKGSLIGGNGVNSGRIASQFDMGTVLISGDIIGGNVGEDAGEVFVVAGKLASLTVSGSVMGGSGNLTGRIFSKGDMNKVSIAGDLVGGNYSGSSSLSKSGVIESDGRIVSVTINGSIVAGQNTGTGTLSLSGAIIAGNDLASLTVKGGILGNNAGGHVSRAMIIGRGQAVPKGTSNVAIGKISVGGDVNLAAILAGFDLTLAAKNADAQIGTVAVTGNWGQSSIAAGVVNAASTNANFGDTNDALMAGAGITNNAAILSKIASITIGGALAGTPAGTNASDHFGFVAEQVLALKIAGVKQVLTPTAHTENLVLGTDGDFVVHEI